MYERTMNLDYLPYDSAGYRDVLGRVFTVVDRRTLINGAPFTGEMVTVAPVGEQRGVMQFTDGWPTRVTTISTDAVRVMIFDPPGYYVRTKIRPTDDADNKK